MTTEEKNHHWTVSFFQTSARSAIGWSKISANACRELVANLQRSTKPRPTPKQKSKADLAYESFERHVGLIFLWVLCVFVIELIFLSQSPSNLAEPFWLNLGISGVTWFICNRSSSRFFNAVADTLQPWVIGAVPVGIVLLAAQEWLPRAQWSWIFAAELFASRCEIQLDKISSYRIATSLSLIAVAFCLNILRPTWTKWTQRVQKALSLTQTLTAALAVFTSFTFFGLNQATEFKQATAQEKRDRLKDQALADAQIILAWRVSEQTSIEAQTTHQYLNAINDGLSLDLEIHHITPADLTTPPPAYSPLDKLLEKPNPDLVQSTVTNLLYHRLSELKNAINTLGGPAAVKVDNAVLAPLLRRLLTNDQVAEAKKQFQGALDVFVQKGADIGSQPLAQLLTSFSLPDLCNSLVSDLYENEVLTLSDAMTDPLADALFRPNSSQTGGPSSPEAAAAVARITDIAGSPVFDAAAVQKDILTPTYEMRLEEYQEKLREEEQLRIQQEEKTREIERDVR